DQACADLVVKSPGLAGSCLQNLSPGSDKFKEIYPQVDWPFQLEYAEKLGLGSREYELVKV
ncbi:MAG TPA: 4Fe-4S ferredoxin, partial [Desulfobaccales bacterium]|nr:4Fe-4S ferredoxin [Desulfobaccales bacterium]